MPYKDPEMRRAYDRERGKRPDRKAAAAEYQRKRVIACREDHLCIECLLPLNKRDRMRCVACQKRASRASWRCVVRNDTTYRRRTRVRQMSYRRYGRAAEYQCIDCTADGIPKQASEWDHWDGYDKPESVWHIEPVCRRHNRLREVQRRRLNQISVG